MGQQTRKEAIDVKRVVRERDGYRCTECGMTNQEHVERFGRQLDVHRRVAGSEYTMEGCATLCRKCHNQKPKSKDGYLVREGLRGVYVELPSELAQAIKRRVELSGRTLRKELEFAMLTWLALTDEQREEFVLTQQKEDHP